MRCGAYQNVSVATILIPLTSEEGSNDRSHCVPWRRDVFSGPCLFCIFPDLSYACRDLALPDPLPTITSVCDVQGHSDIQLFLPKSSNNRQAHPASSAAWLPSLLSRLLEHKFSK
jgi:hypothetical protein